MTAISVWMLVVPLTWGQLGTTRVAVVNIPMVSEKYARTMDLEAHFEQVRRTFNEQREKLRGNIERSSRALQEQFKPGSDEFRTRQKQLVMLQAEEQWLVESQGRRVEAALATSLLSIFKDIQTVVRQTAQAKGVDLVLAYDELPREPPSSPTQVRQQIVLQKVLYASPQTNLTQDVIQRLNAAYQSNGSKPLVGIGSAGGNAAPTDQ